MLGRIQNDLFDLGADLSVPDTGKKLDYEPLRIIAAQTARVEADIDRLNKRPEAAEILHPAGRHRRRRRRSILPAPSRGAPSG